MGENTERNCASLRNFWKDDNNVELKCNGEEKAVEMSHARQKQESHYPPMPPLPIMYYVVKI